MTQAAIYQLLLYLAIILALVKPLGWYMAKVFAGQPCGLNTALRPLENLIYRCCGVDPEQGMDWKQYAVAFLWFSFVSVISAYILQRIQAILPLNPQNLPAVPEYLALNVATSMVSNTGWQSYAGEVTLSYCSQMLVLTVHGFISAAVGMAVLVAFIRGLARYETTNLGNFWSDLVRGVLYIMLPLAIVLALFLVSQGVIQNFAPNFKTATLESPDVIQTIPMGPVASLVSIRQLSSMGGGFFNVNAAHPFENPNAVTNLTLMLCIILIPAALCYVFGVMVNDRRQGWILLVAMLLMFIPCALFTMSGELTGNPEINAMHVTGNLVNMEGKEVRIGAASSALWATATTATGNGSVNSMHDSFMPLGGMVMLVLMHIGEIIFGGVGSGLYGMLLMVIINVFISGLMVGRTPEYLGKKIDPYDMKLVALIVLIMPLVVLLFAAFASVTTMGTSSIANPGAHGLSEILYAFTSMRNNNGSAFAGLNSNTDFYNIAGAISILMGRYWVALPCLAIAGSLVRKRVLPASNGTLTTHNLLFAIFLVGIIVIIGGLSYLPAMALGPIVEHLIIWENYGG